MEKLLQEFKLKISDELLESLVGKITDVVETIIDGAPYLVGPQRKHLKNDIKDWIQKWLKYDDEEEFIQEFEMESTRVLPAEFEMKLIKAILESDLGEEIENSVLEKYKHKEIQDRIADICRVLTGKSIHDLDVYTRRELEEIVGEY